MFQNIDNNILLWFNGAQSEALNPVILFFTSGYTWIPLYVALVAYILWLFPRRKALLVIAFAVMCIAITAGCNELLVKPLVARVRPLYDPSLAGLLNVVPGFHAHGYSFFSSHAANTSTIALFVSLSLRRRWVTCIMLCYCLLNCYTRLYLGAHYPSDILVGLTFGTLTALSVYWVSNHFTHCHS